MATKTSSKGKKLVSPTRTSQQDGSMAATRAQYDLALRNNIDLALVNNYLKRYGSGEGSTVSGLSAKVSGGKVYVTAQSKSSGRGSGAAGADGIPGLGFQIPGYGSSASGGQGSGGSLPWWMPRDGWAPRDGSPATPLSGSDYGDMNNPFGSGRFVGGVLDKTFIGTMTGQLLGGLTADDPGYFRAYDRARAQAREMYNQGMENWLNYSRGQRERMYRERRAAALERARNRGDRDVAVASSQAVQEEPVTMTRVNLNDEAERLGAVRVGRGLYFGDDAHLAEAVDAAERLERNNDASHAADKGGATEETWRPGDPANAGAKYEFQDPRGSQGTEYTPPTPQSAGDADMSMLMGGGSADKATNGRRKVSETFTRMPSASDPGRFNKPMPELSLSAKDKAALDRNTPGWRDDPNWRPGSRADNAPIGPTAPTASATPKPGAKTASSGGYTPVGGWTGAFARGERIGRDGVDKMFAELEKRAGDETARESLGKRATWNDLAVIREARKAKAAAKRNGQALTAEEQAAEKIKDERLAAEVNAKGADVVAKEQLGKHATWDDLVALRAHRKAESDKRMAQNAAELAAVKAETDKVTAAADRRIADSQALQRKIQEDWRKSDAYRSKQIFDAKVDAVMRGGAKKGKFGEDLASSGYTGSDEELGVRRNPFDNTITFGASVPKRGPVTSRADAEQIVRDSMTVKPDPRLVAARKEEQERLDAANKAGSLRRAILENAFPEQEVDVGEETIPLRHPNAWGPAARQALDAQYAAKYDEHFFLKPQAWTNWALNWFRRPSGFNYGDTQILADYTQGLEEHKAVLDYLDANGGVDNADIRVLYPNIKPGSAEEQKLRAAGYPFLYTPTEQIAGMAGYFTADFSRGDVEAVKSRLNQSTRLGQTAAAMHRRFLAERRATKGGKK